MGSNCDYAGEDIGNIVLMEHVNLEIPDQQMATLFYVIGLGLTRDPYINVGLENMWINVGEHQFHLPTRGAQVIPGHIGLVVPNLELLQERLKGVQERLKGSNFNWSIMDSYIAVTCPWGNQFRCYAPTPKFGDMILGVPYVEFLVKPNTVKGIVRFYSKVMGAPSAVDSDQGGPVARIDVGRNQCLFFREAVEKIRPYDGHHIAVYVANFSGPYSFLKRRDLIMEDFRNHQFRFKAVVDPKSGKDLFVIEHEVRSLRHPMYHRFFVNREPTQTQRKYARGRDSLIPISA